MHWTATVSSFGVFGFFECLAALLLFGETCLPASGLERFNVVLIGCLSFFAQIGLVVSAQFESAANVALLRKAFDVIFAFIFQILFFHVSYYLEYCASKRSMIYKKFNTIYLI